MVKKKSISLDKINDQFQQLKQAQSIINRATESWAATKGNDPSYHYLRTEISNDQLIGIRDEIVYWLCRQYTKTFCPNITVTSFVDGLFDSHDTEFDAYKVIDAINEAVILNSEKIAFEQLKSGAERILGGEYKESSNLLKKGALMLRGIYRSSHSWDDHNGKKQVSYTYTINFRLFELFCLAVLKNRNLFDREAPSQIRGPLYWSTVLNRNDIKAGKFDEHKGHYIKRVELLKSGRLDVYFQTEEDLYAVVDALKGKQPEYHFPKIEINVEKMFIKTGRTRRVVKINRKEKK